MEIQSYPRVLRARERWILPVAVLAVAGAAGVSLLTTPTYSASTQFLVSTSAEADAGAAYTDC